MSGPIFTAAEAMMNDFDSAEDVNLFSSYLLGALLALLDQQQSPQLEAAAVEAMKAVRSAWSTGGN
jgi:hypothetical protein